MNPLGSHLRNRRESLGLTLEQVSRSTRVGTEYLRAMEEERWRDLPAPVFAKGFIRAYCQALREPPDEALRQYGALSEKADAALVTPSWAEKPRAITPTISLSLSLVIVLGAALLALSFLLRDQSIPVRTAVTKPPEAFTQTAVPREATPPTITTPAAPTPELPPTSSAKGRSRLVARTSEATWVRVTTDDGSVVQELLPPGATREWSSAKRFVLTVGNAGGISLEYNGRPLPALGPRGAVIQKLVIPPEEEGAREIDS